MSQIWSLYFIRHQIHSQYSMTSLTHFYLQKLLQSIRNYVLIKAKQWKNKLVNSYLFLGLRRIHIRSLCSSWKHERAKSAVNLLIGNRLSRLCERNIMGNLIAIRLFRIMSISTTFRLFLVLTSEQIGRRPPVFTLLLWQRQHIIVVDVVDYK